MIAGPGEKMWLKDPGNFTTCKKFFNTGYACPYLFGMMRIIINKSQSRNINPDIKAASYPWKSRTALRISFSSTPHIRAMAIAAVKFSMLIIPGNAKCRSSIVIEGVLILKL